MDILEFFDITNIEHLRAYRQLNKIGVWPKGFIPEDTTFGNAGWFPILADRMANAYINDKIHLYNG